MITDIIISKISLAFFVLNKYDLSYFGIGETMKNKNFWFKKVSKICFCVILTLVTLIILKSKPSLKSSFYREVYEKNFSFSTINSLYKKYIGSSMLFNVFEKESTPVFNNKLDYTEANKYLDGVKLTVGNNYLVPTLDSGLVIFIGEKEGYGNTIIVQQANGVDVWYSNIDNITVKLYDYVESGSLIGEVKDDYFYLVFKKDGGVLNYQDYI